MPGLFRWDGSGERGEQRVWGRKGTGGEEISGRRIKSYIYEMMET